MIPSHHFTYLDGYCESQPTDVLQQRPGGGLVWNSIPRQDSNCRQFHFNFYPEIPVRSDRISGNLPWFALFLELTNTFLGRWDCRDCRLLGRNKNPGERREPARPPSYNLSQRNKSNGFYSFYHSLHRGGSPFVIIRERFWCRFYLVKNYHVLSHVLKFQSCNCLCYGGYHIVAINLDFMRNRQGIFTLSLFLLCGPSVLKALHRCRIPVMG